MNLVINAQLHRTQQSASLILISRSARAPRGRAVWRGGREGRGAERARRPRPARAEAGRELLARRRVRAGGSAAARLVLLLGRRRRRRLQPSSPRLAAPGVRSTFSRSFPHTAPREGSWAHTHTAPARTLPWKKKKFGNQSERGGAGKSPTEERRLGSPLGAAAAGGAGRRWRSEANSVCPEKPLSPPSGPARLASLALTLRLGAGDCAGPLLTFRVSLPRVSSSCCPTKR